VHNLVHSVDVFTAKSEAFIQVALLCVYKSLRNAVRCSIKVIEREIPGMSFAALMLSLQKTPHAVLSRAKAGVAGTTLIINLPGSTKGAQEIIEYLDPALKHAVPIIHGEVIE